MFCIDFSFYGGYVPQFTFTFGDTYGRTTHELLTDPSVRKSPRSLLAPLDSKENLLQYHYHIDHPAGNRRCGTARRGCSSRLHLASAASAQCHPTESHLRVHWLHPLLPGQRWHDLPAGCEESHAGAEPPKPLLLPGPHGRASIPSIPEHRGLICAVDRCSLPAAGTAETPEEPQPALHPRTKGSVCWLLERNPPYTLGRRFPLTHWPDTKIYTRAGLIPNYMGFVPHLQDICGLTYGDGTRESYRWEQRRRGLAL
ncbi:ciliary microtubule inner protein 2A [Passerculus sandwichensis]